MPPNGPAPTKATFFTLPDRVVVDFDGPLTAGPLDTANWFIRRLNQGWPTPSVAAAAAAVTITLGAPGWPNPGFDSVSYRPPPFDLLSATGQPSAGFDHYPITP